MELLTQLVVPPPPTRLAKAEREIYDAIGADLVAANILQTIDGHVLAQLARDMVTAARLERLIRREGEVYTTHNGYPVPNPRNALLAKALDRIFRAETALGMTPAGRRALKQAGDPAKVNANNARSKWEKRRIAK